MPKRILVVDDEVLLLKVLTRQLQQLGYEVRTACGGEEALELAGKEPFDLVLIDNVMPPGPSGLEVLPRLVELTRAPVLLMTGHDDGELRKDAAALGARTVLSKPMGGAELARQLSLALDS